VLIISLVPGEQPRDYGPLLLEIKYPIMLIQLTPQEMMEFSLLRILNSEHASKTSKLVTTEMEMAIAMTGMTKKVTVVPEMFTL